MKKGAIYLATGFIICCILAMFARTQVQQNSGLAVAASATKWSNVKDAGAMSSDAQSSGLLAVGQMLYNGTSWDRARVVADNGTNPAFKSPVLAALANTARPTWTDGKIAPLSVDISGALRTSTVTSSSFTTNWVTVDTTSGGVLIKAANTSRKSITIRNIGSVDMYIGNSGVTTATGFLLQAATKEAYTFDRNTAAVYGITAATSTTACYIEE